jgi:hypothetical protein
VERSDLYTFAPSSDRAFELLTAQITLENFMKKRRFLAGRTNALVLGLSMLSAVIAANGQALPSGIHPMKPSFGHQADFGLGGAGQFTTSITNQETHQSPGLGFGAPLPRQWTTQSLGALATLRDRPFTWVGLEVNYQFTRYSERFQIPAAPFASPSLLVYVPTSVHEYTAAFVFQSDKHALKPFLALGGGYQNFQPTGDFSHQWRETALLDLGVDIPTQTKLGFRIGARDLVFRAPNFQNTALASSRWVSEEEPYVMAYIKF